MVLKGVAEFRCQTCQRQRGGLELDHTEEPRSSSCTRKCQRPLNLSFLNRYAYDHTLTSVQRTVTEPLRGRSGFVEDTPRA
jgi:hypothetical protein